MRALTVNRALSRAAAFAASLALLSACGQSAPAEPTGPERFISTTGQGEVSAAPDRAEIRVGVQTEAESAAEAMRLNGDAMSEVLAKVKNGDLDQNADVRTLQVSVRPRYERVATTVGGLRRRTLVGYTAVNSVVVTVKDVEKVAEVLDALTKAGANRTEGVSFFLDDRSQIEDEARAKALADARRKAELFAKESGVTLGPLVNIVETRPFRSFNRNRPRMTAGTRGAPIAPGEQIVRVALNARWSIVDAK